jgi:glycerophosphoryl diester phosphodiesterase
LKEKKPNVSIALLIEKNNSQTIKQQVQILGFTPDIYSPEYTRINQDVIKTVRELNMQLIPWTVNDSTEMVNLIKMGVDGIITDYPDILLNIKKSLLLNQ